MLARVGLITDDDLAAIEGGLQEIQSEIDEQDEQWPGWKLDLEDIHMCIEAALVDKIGDAGRKLHTGRSRNDQVALDLLLWIEEACGDLEQQFDALFRALVELARRDGMIVMPAYTHLQRAQPIVVGAELMAWLSGLDRSRSRLKILRTINLSNPLGSGAIAGSSLPLDRLYTAQQLPVGDPTANSIDATASRDAAIDFVYALAMIAMNLSRWAEQWIIYASTEFGFIRLSDPYTTGSSMMPQKQNPDMLELIRGRCGGVYGQLVALLTMCKGLTIGYNRDLQEDKRWVFIAYDTVRDSLEMATRLVTGTTFQADKIQSTLRSGFLDATSLADFLVTRDVPFRRAHEIVGSLVRTCHDQGLEELAALSQGDFDRACTKAGLPAGLCGADVYAWLGAENVVKRYQSAGNAGVSGFEQQLLAWESRLGDKLTD